MNSVGTVVFAVGIGVVLLISLWRWFHRRAADRADPVTRQSAARVVAVDLSTTLRARLSGSDFGDAVRARVVAQSLTEFGPDGVPRTFFGNWIGVSDLEIPVRRQVLTSTFFVMDMMPNIRISDPALKADALRQMQVKDGWFHFVLDDPVPVTVLESAQGAFHFDYR